MKFDRTEPCESCPYRRDTRLKRWDKREFTQLLAHDRSQLGAVYQCHQERLLPESERRPCVGWAIDQKKRSEPSIMFRILLMKSEIAHAWFTKLDVKYPGLFRTLAAMCRANGVPSRQRSNT